MQKFARAGSFLMAAVFVYAAALQYNDPDPLRWAAIYLAAAAACVLCIASRLSWQVAGVIALIALVWAGALAARLVGHVSLLQMFDTWKMTNAAVEEAREMFGLLIIAAWMGVLLVGTLRRRAAA